MIIDSIADKSAIDIASLTVSEPVRRRDVWFDPKRDILPSQWNEAGAYLTTLRPGSPNENIGEWSLLARSLFILAPERRWEFEIDERMRQVLFKKIESASTEWIEHWREFIELAFCAKTLYPEHAADLQLNDDKFRKILKAMKGQIDRKTHAAAFAWSMIPVAALFPDRLEEILPDRELILQALNHDIGRERKRADYFPLMFEGATLKIFFPEQTLDINQLEKAKLRQELVSLRGDFNVLLFWEVAVRMYILSAEEVRIGEEGLIINLRKPEDPETVEKIPEMPVKRIF